ncbi:adenine deaminase [Anaerosalibacter massiliensis]|uniref:Adenine deaminase n=1 Tax=Anaerosalibacter massiliensis TaxID=1347392 RepID=A0A9X2MLR2_9FIRM|nr:adenine deaminase [Anaerosalibacter massiliensis]MCR2045462.1 adenine deaminase [Anaerosalibacter massiliensis]
MEKNELKNIISISKGEEKAELVLKNCSIINVFTNEIINGDIAIYNGKIAGIGDYKGKKEIDLEGKFVSPGFIDGHVHIESSMVSPSQFARAIVPRGTTTIIADPHEIANVKGIDGIKYILDDSENIPLDVYIMLPSCVPATPFENSGANLRAEDLKELIDHERVLGLGELMNYPGVINGDDEVLDKIIMAEGKKIDGHGPLLEKGELNAYIASGVSTEHECSTVEEMKNRLRLGMYILIREGSAAKNLKELIKVVNKDNINRCLFCTDDKHPEDILKDGHINYNIKLAIKEGTDPIDAIKMATLNGAECYGLKDRGAIVPGYIADLVVIDNLEEFNILKVFKNGKLVGENYNFLSEINPIDTLKVKNSVNIGEITLKDLDIKLKSRIVNVIKLHSHSLFTEKVEREIDLVDGKFEFGKENILKVAVVERHNKTGNIGLGLVENFGLEKGAIASTIAHDSHNIIVIGDSDEDILKAIKEIERMGGGITIVSDRKVVKSLPLAIAGLMSDDSLEYVNNEFKEMLNIAYEKLNVNSEIDPFMTLSFIALPVIPEIKITDLGLFDVKEFKFIDI